MAYSAYLHIPFCKSKCKYCSFVSYPACTEETKQLYVDTIIKEIKHFYTAERLKTLYLGGGTPSLLPISNIERILSCFNYDDNCEITMEINPETVDFNYLCDLKKAGVNRISIGVQSFDNNILKNIGRIHSAEKAVETVKTAQKADFENISCDFIYGLPNQNRESFVNDLKNAVDLNVQHISLYGLKIEEGCYFYTNMPENLADDDLQADMYLDAIETLTQSGFEHYEISNFCRHNYHSRHNLNYWDCGEYYGFGAGAHGYVNGVRYSNYCSLEDYFKNYANKASNLELSNQEKLEEAIFLGFRRGNGIDIEEINKKFNIDFEEKYTDILEKYLKSGHLKKTDNRYRLSEEGFLVSNVILAEFIMG